MPIVWRHVNHSKERHPLDTCYHDFCDWSTALSSTSLPNCDRYSVKCTVTVNGCHIMFFFFLRWSKMWIVWLQACTLSVPLYLMRTYTASDGSGLIVLAPWQPNCIEHVSLSSEVSCMWCWQFLAAAGEKRTKISCLANVGQVEPLALSWHEIKSEHVSLASSCWDVCIDILPFWLPILWTSLQQQFNLLAQWNTL